MSDTPRTSAWWKSRYPDYMRRDCDIKLVIDALAAEEKAHAITLEALAESERLRAAYQNAADVNYKRYLISDEEMMKQKARAEKAEEEAENAHALAEAYKKDRADLRATFDRTVAAWKREELSWDAERKALTAERDEALRDVRQCHDAIVEGEDKLAAVTLDNARLRQGLVELRGEMAREPGNIYLEMFDAALAVAPADEMVKRYRCVKCGMVFQSKPLVHYAVDIDGQPMDWCDGSLAELEGGPHA